MIKKIIVMFVSVACVAAVTACAPVTVHTDQDWAGGNPCSPEQKRLLVDITASYPTGDEADPVYVEPNIPADLLFQAFSPDPEYGGVVYVGTGLNRNNPEIVEVITPYFANACFRADRPVAVMVRAWMAASTVDRAGLGIKCAISDEETFGSRELGQVDEIRTTVADLIAPAKGYDMLVQCVHIHVPGDWTGAPMPEHPFPPLNR